MTNKEIKLGIYNETPVEWLVLEETEDKYLLLSKYALDLRRFDFDTNDYEKSEIKDFLENYMLKRIGIFDNLFLLSKEEVEKYFSEEKDRIVFLESNKYGKDVRYSWWLRSPNYSFVSSAYGVSGDGSIGSNYVFGAYSGIRPACWVKKEIVE